MKMLKEIGLIGLGVMGKNIALNLSDNGVSIKAFNDSKEKLANKLCSNKLMENYENA